MSADHASLQHLFVELDAFHRDGDPSLLRVPRVQGRSRGYLDDLLTDPRSTVLVADEAGECVGLAIVHLQDAPDLPVFIPQTWAVIDALGVRSYRRRRGLGRALHEACVAWAREENACWVELTVYEFNKAARQFYESLGFETVRRRLRAPLD